ncbi:PH domain-containing protein [Tsukamurella spumae]|uniref:PH domain-containing protein n=1 Tax=Tsukamurella spumae TaxID=44753 RepID=A0A846X656_9ACTN|nr:PH domain-containing protein [Tsukamurella spumae]NKY20944.1 PH domain-containing protein [Tsukamurella spumae]
MSESTAAPGSTGATRTVTTDHTADTAVPIAAGDRVVFKHPSIALIGVALFAVCLAPIVGPWTVGRAVDGSTAGAGAAVLGWALLVIPVLLALWILRVRTVIGPDGVRSVGVLRATTITWDEMSGIRIGDNGAVYAVRADGSEVRLPAVTISQLPRVAAASGGRIPDVTAE